MFDITFFQSIDFINMKKLAYGGHFGCRYVEGDNICKHLQMLIEEGFSYRNSTIYWDNANTGIAGKLHSEAQEARKQLKEQLDLIKRAVYDGEKCCRRRIEEPLIPMLRAECIANEFKVNSNDITWE